MGQYIPLDAKSLMIGDWVYNKHHGKNIRLTPYDFFTHTHNEFGEQELAPFANPTIGRDLEPIQLTKEILEKNGFEEDFYSIITANGFERLPEYKYKNMKEARDIRRNLIRVAYSNTEGGVYDIQAGIGSHIFSLKYVHELQHALRIMKIDKEIVI